jgi:hypothetical protein
MLPFAQCVMCFRNAAAQQLERSHILNQAILVLLIPPLLILFGLLWLARSTASSPEADQSTPSPHALKSPNTYGD